MACATCASALLRASISDSPHSHLIKLFPTNAKSQTKLQLLISLCLPPPCLQTSCRNSELSSHLSHKSTEYQTHKLFRCANPFKEPATMLALEIDRLRSSTRLIASHRRMAGPLSGPESPPYGSVPPCQVTRYTFCTSCSVECTIFWGLPRVVHTAAAVERDFLIIRKRI